MIKDPHGTYYIGLENPTSLEKFDVGDTSVFAHRNDPFMLQLSLVDFYLFRFDPDYNLTGSFVIDNAENVTDFYSTGDHSFISMTLWEQNEPEDSLYPIKLNGDYVINREGNRGKGILIVLNENLELTKAIIPYSGKLEQIAAEGNNVYMEFIIPDYHPYILIGGDTVYNHTYADPPGIEYGRQTVVICKYDFVAEEVIWWLRIGNVGYEELYEMQVDKIGNLLIQGTTTSSNFSFDANTTMNNSSSHNPFIGKYNPSGENILAILNPNEVNEFTQDFTSDNEGNIYRVGRYYGPAFAIGDTMLLNPWLGDKYPYRGIVIKHDAEGNFKWVAQLDGIFEETSLGNISILNEETLIISGLFYNGEIQFNGEIYHHQSTGMDENSFLWVLNAENGSYENHIMTQGINYRRFDDLSLDENQDLNLYMRFFGQDTMFNSEFENHGDRNSGFLVKLDMSFITSVYDPHLSYENYYLYPNPVSQGQNINVKAESNLEQFNLYIEIYDQRGIVVSSGSSKLIDSRNFISTNSLLPGTYWVLIRNASSYGVELLIIK